MQEFSIFQTYVIYGIVILLTVFFAKTSVKSNYKIVRKLATFLTILIPSIVAGLRYYVGTDYETYYNLYSIINSGEKTRIEYGFELLNKALYLIGLNEQSIFFASSLLIIFFIYKALYSYRETLDIGLGMAIFMLLYYFSSFNVIRLMIAVSICFYNVENIKEKKFLKFLIYNLIAISFHNTAITQLPMYFVYNYIVSKRNIITQICVYCLIIICMINFNETFEFILNFMGKEKGIYYSSYIGISENSIVTVFKEFLIYCPILIIGILIYNTASKIDKYYYIYFSNFVIGVILLSISSLLNKYVSRIGEYYIIYSITLIQIYSKALNINKRFTIKWIFILYALFMFIYSYVICGNHQIFPYKILL